MVLITPRNFSNPSLHWLLKGLKWDYVLCLNLSVVNNQEARGPALSSHTEGLAPAAFLSQSVLSFLTLTGENEVIFIFRPFSILYCTFRDNIFLNINIFLYKLWKGKLPPYQTSLVDGQMACQSTSGQMGVLCKTDAAFSWFKKLTEFLELLQNNSYQTHFDELCLCWSETYGLNFPKV